MRHARFLAACSAVVLAGGMAQAAVLIPVPDGGFEADTNTGWHQFDLPNSGQWAMTVSAGDWWGSGIYNVGAGQGAPSEGAQFLQFYPGLKSGGPGTFGSATFAGAAFPVTTTTGNTYTAAVDITLAPTNIVVQAGSPSVTINLMEGATLLATGTASATNGWTTLAAVPYTATDSAVHNLSVQIVATNFYGNGGGDWNSTNVNLDNVTLTETPVPEPAVLSMIGLSSLGLLARRRKA